jgi:membrane-associated HD superfamily phosphohydrolase
MMIRPFSFSLLEWRHKKWYLLQKMIIFAMIGLMTYLAIVKTNPVLATRDEKMSVSMGVVVGLIVMMFVVFQWIKSIIVKHKFLMFLIAWIILMSLQPIMDTLIWSIGLNIIPLAIDEIIFRPIWESIWYNNYER